MALFFQGQSAILLVKVIMGWEKGWVVGEYNTLRIPGRNGKIYRLMGTILEMRR